MHSSVHTRSNTYYHTDAVNHCYMLPSDHWGDMIDCLFCHMPPSETLPEDSLGLSIMSSRSLNAIKGKAGLKESSIMLSREDIDEDRVMISYGEDTTCNISQERTHPVKCISCSSYIGFVSVSDTSETNNIHLYKHMIKLPSNPTHGKSNDVLTQYSLETYLALTLMHYIRGQHCYRFLIFAAGDGVDVLCLKIIVTNTDVAIATNKQNELKYALKVGDEYALIIKTSSR